MGRTLNMTLRGEAGREGAWHGAAVGGFWLGRGIVTAVGGVSPGPARRFHPAGCTPLPGALAACWVPEEEPAAGAGAGGEDNLFF